ncbi:MAG: hypothetical protein U1E65_17850 [Myxococcota bacterium]
MKLEIEEDRVFGQLKLPIAPGTVRKAQQRAIDEALAGPLEEAAAALGVIVSAAPSSFARQLPGRDPEGMITFEIRGRTEGDRLVPGTPAPT